jgi:hypothetical protein
MFRLLFSPRYRFRARIARKHSIRRPIREAEIRRLVEPHRLRYVSPPKHAHAQDSSGQVVRWRGLNDVEDSHWTGSAYLVAVAMLSPCLAAHRSALSIEAVYWFFSGVIRMANRGGICWTPLKYMGKISDDLMHISVFDTIWGAPTLRECSKAWRRLCVASAASLHSISRRLRFFDESGTSSLHAQLPRTVCTVSCPLRA